MFAMLLLVFLMTGFLRGDGRVFKVTGNGQVSADNKKMTLQLEMVAKGGAVPTGRVTPGGVTPGGVTPGRVTPGRVTPGGVTPARVTPAGIKPTEAGSSQAGEAYFTQMELDALKEHNKFRATHGAPPMTLNETMCDEATAYAQELAKRKSGLKHSPKEEREGQGENLSMGCGMDRGETVQEAVAKWYNEVCDPGYQFGVDKSQSGTGHFSQVVWKASTVLGIGKAGSTQYGLKCSYIVARYKPAGNLIGSYPQNVLQGTFQQSYCAKISSSRKG